VEHEACDVCSRTLLKGEEIHEYVTQQGQRLGVCVLCRPRAEASGWIPAEQYGAVAQEPPSRPRRGQALRRRLGQVASKARGGGRSAGGAAERDDAKERPEPERSSDQGPSGEGEDRADPAPATNGAAAEAPAPAADGAPAKPAAPAAEGAPAKPRQAKWPSQAKQARRPRPQAKRRPKRGSAGGPAAPSTPRPRRGPEAIMRAAVERFNASEEARKVAGLIRSLGEPRAAVRAEPKGQLALVTVAWELSWYVWEVSAEGDAGNVREVGKGRELSELDEDAQGWNAAVAEDGTLRLRGAGTPRQPSAKQA
jgi:hypothetical protein